MYISSSYGRYLAPVSQITWFNLYFFSEYIHNTNYAKVTKLCERMREKVLKITCSAEFFKNYILTKTYDLLYSIYYESELIYTSLMQKLSAILSKYYFSRTLWFWAITLVDFFLLKHTFFKKAELFYTGQCRSKRHVAFEIINLFRAAKSPNKSSMLLNNYWSIYMKLGLWGKLFTISETKQKRKL